MSTTYYAVQAGHDRLGEFQFLEHVQGNLSTDLDKTNKDRLNIIREIMDSYEPSLTMEEAVKELGGLKVYKVTLEVVG